MKISIITIGFNNEYGYRATLPSIIEQSCKDYELIVVDGGSTDGSLKVIQSFSSYISHLISEKDRGIYHAMNKDIKCASGEYCLFLNSGDTFHNADVLRRACDKLSGGDFYSGHLQRFNKRKCWVNYSPKLVTAHFLVQKALYHPSTFIRTQLLKERPYNEDLKIVADWEEMVYELLLRNRSYEQLDFIVSNFNTEGISSSEEHQKLQDKERTQVLYTLFTPLVADALFGTSKFERRILYALTKENKLKRDLKMIRNLLKVIPIDFFHHFFGRKGNISL